MTTLYRITTEDTGAAGRATVNEIVGRLFDSFTTIRGRGCWKGGSEDSYIVEIHAGHMDSFRVRDAAIRIKAALKQEAVLIQTIPCAGELV